MRASVGVTPPEALRRRSELFGVLDDVFPVDFVPREVGAWDGLDALVVLGPDVPELDRRRRPVLVFTGEESGDEQDRAAIELADHPLVDGRLGGRRLDERHAPTDVRRLDREGTPLANDEHGVLWAALPGEVQAAALAPVELGTHESLRDRFEGGRFLALLPLLQLLRRVTAYEESVRPAPRGVFLVDDPNLHWRSYGYVHFGRIAEDARRHGYHVAFATVPLDLWRSSRSAVRTFRDAGDALSLALHGNDHTYQELASPLPSDEAVALFDQAVDRARRFERRTGVEISRVMIPPHGLCSEEVLGPMLAAGIEALCRAPGWSDAWDERRRRTARWFPADVSPSGAPILERHLISGPHWRDEIALGLYLDRPAIVYGHHYDLAGGYGVLADAADWLNGFEGMSWSSLGAIARSNLVAVLDGDVLRVEAFARRALIDLPDGVRSVELVFPGHAAFAEDAVLWNGEVVRPTAGGDAAVRVDVTDGATEGEVRLERRRRVTGAARRAARPSAVARRGAVEVRDRLHPVIRGLGLAGALRSLEGAYGRRARARVGSETGKD